MLATTVSRSGLRGQRGPCTCIYSYGEGAWNRENSMITADEYRKWAYFALCQEAECQSAADRALWFQLAQDWADLADQQDRQDAVSHEVSRKRMKPAAEAHKAHRNGTGAGRPAHSEARF